jgi:hypothetical protein
MYHVWGEGRSIPDFGWETRERDCSEEPGVDGRSTYIKMDLQEVGCGGMDWFDVTQERDRWWAVVNAVMNLRIL